MVDTRLPQPSGSFRWVQAEAGLALVCSALDSWPHLITTREWQLGNPSSSDAAAGWEEVARAMSVARADLIHLRQVHGSMVFVRRSGAAASEASEADIIISSDPRAAIAVKAADCVPLLLADERSGVVAAAHAGWRGLSIRVPAVAVAALRREFDSRPADLTAVIGPSIGACCYEVGGDVLQRFQRTGATVDQVARWFHQVPQPSDLNPSLANLPGPRADHWYFDAWRATADQLQGSGVAADRIHTAALCTASHPNLLCSYRRDGAPAGRLVAAIRAR